MNNLSTVVKLLGLIAVTSWSGVASAEQKFYKWVDKKGATHYTQAPPPASEVRRVAVKRSGKQTANSRPVRTVSVSTFTPSNPVPMATPSASGNSGSNAGTTDQALPVQSGVVSQQSGQPALSQTGGQAAGLPASGTGAMMPGTNLVSPALLPR